MFSFKSLPIPLDEFVPGGNKVIEDDAVPNDVDLVDVRFSWFKMLVVATLGDVIFSITEESLVVDSGLSSVALKKMYAY